MSLKTANSTLRTTKTNYYQHECTPELHGSYSRVAEPTSSHQLFTGSPLAGLPSTDAHTSDEAPSCICKKLEIL